MRRVYWWLIVAVGTAVLLWILPVGALQQGTAVLFFWLLPIATWLPLMPAIRNPQSAIRNGTHWLSAAGFVLLLHAVGMLLMHYLPGPVPQVLLLGWGVGIVIFPVGLGIRLTRTQENTDEEILRHGGVEAQREEEQSVKSVKSVVPILLLIAFILLLRLPNMGYKELQGDEGIILTRAAAALAGDDEVLFLHQKGPVEIVLPMLIWGGTGTIDEFWARWPFLWANVLAVLALAALAQRWFGSKVGWVTGVLLAVNGFTIAFARIIQYQSFVLLWGLLALLHADRYREDRNAWDLGLMAVFLAGSLLSHYDAVLVVPAVLWLIWPHLQISRWREWLPVGTVGLVLLMLFYVPFVRHPNFAKTQSYLLGARLGQEPSEAVVRWSGAEVWQMVTFYNSSYYIIGLFVGLLIGLLVLRQEKNGRIAALLMFLVPLLFYTIIVDDARTHVYTIFPGATLLAAVGVVWLWRKWRGVVRWLVGWLVGLFVAVSAVYVWLLFVDTIPERQRTWAENRPAFFPTTWDAPPQFGLFGFPYQAGWRAVGDLPLALPYASNEEEEITNVYMAQANRTHCPDFNTFILTQHVQDEVPYDPAWLDGLYLQYEVTVNGRSTMQIYRREAVTAVTHLEAANTQRWLTPAEVAPPKPTGDLPVNVVLGDRRVRLLGYDLDKTNAVPGGQVRVTLYWQAIRPFTQNFQVFTHLFNGEVVAQHDGAPECDINPTTRWEPGQVIPDTHLIDIPPDAPPGPVTLLAGMYTLLPPHDRLAVPETADNTLRLMEITIRE